MEVKRDSYTWGALVLAGLLAGPAAWAAPLVGGDSEVVWPTFLRTGPSSGALVIDELPRGRHLRVVGCEGEWCRVTIERSDGYVAASSLASFTPASPRPSTGAGLGCFSSVRAGHGNGERFVYCPVSAAQAPPLAAPTPSSSALDSTATRGRQGP